MMFEADQRPAIAAANSAIEAESAKACKRCRKCGATVLIARNNAARRARMANPEYRERVNAARRARRFAAKQARGT